MTKAARAEAGPIQRMLSQVTRTTIALRARVLIARATGSPRRGARRRSRIAPFRLASSRIPIQITSARTITVNRRDCLRRTTGVRSTTCTDTNDHPGAGTLVHAIAGQCECRWEPSGQTRAHPRPRGAHRRDGSATTLRFLGRLAARDRLAERGPSRTASA